MNVRKTALFIFLLAAGIYAMTLNSWNAKLFGLQAATVAALAERGRFELIDRVLPDFKLAEGDETFRYGSAIYPMKQPGQTILGAIIYTPMMFARFYMLNHYDYVIHFITFFTSVLMVASVAALVYLIAGFATKNERIAKLTAAILALATIVWPYAGVMHHDIYATFFVAWGIFFYLIYLYKDKQPKFLGLSGIFMGVTLFFSMLPVTMPFVLLALVAMRKKGKEIVYYAGGLLGGLIPSFIFNYSQFGNLFAFPNLAGRVADTIPFWSITNFLNHVYFYLLSPYYSLTVYSPVLLFGIAGLLMIPPKYKEAKKVLIGLPLFLLIHICTQATYGGYQYGPRYLLPAIPMLSLGIPFFLTGVKNRIWLRIFYLTLIYSLIIAWIGAIQTAMSPVSSSPILHPSQFGPWDSLKAIMAGNLPKFRMIPVGALMIVLGLLIYFSGKFRRLWPLHT